MFRVRFFLILMIVFINSAFADTATDSWLQATANSRAAGAALQSQVAAGQLNQDQQQQQTQMLNSMQQQNNQVNNQQTTQTTITPNSSQVQPATPTTTPDPWNKPNPWQNTQINPYAGQQYTSSPNSSATTTNTNNSSSTIYAPQTSTPQTNTPQTTQQPQGTNSTNIYQ